MSQIKLKAEIDERREIHIQLPKNVPIGTIDLTIEYHDPAEKQPAMTREEIRRRLLEGGVLSTHRYAPENAVELSTEEAERIGRLIANPARSTWDYINEDREDRI